MYEFELGAGVTTPPLGPNLRSVHETRRQLIEAPVRAALAAAGPGARALDLACNEGWFSHRMLDWGAERPVGVDIREDNVRRANLIRDHFGITADRLSFRQADVLHLDPEELGRFDVVLVLGLIYHMERPLDALRIARRLTSGVCLIESQLTRQDRPIVLGTGRPHVYEQRAEGFAAFVENDPENPLASTAGVMSLVPNRAALEAMPLWAGFAAVEWLPAQSHHDVQYIAEDRGVVAAYVSEPSS
jgi:tRNA (mo5U34)-methyltransferase